MIVMYIMALAYICFTLCLAELMSAIPFSGGTVNSFLLVPYHCCHLFTALALLTGSYGFARVTLGQVPAFFVGLAETTEYITFAVNPIVTIGQGITVMFGTVQLFLYFLVLFGLLVFYAVVSCFLFAESPCWFGSRWKRFQPTEFWIRHRLQIRVHLGPDCLRFCHVNKLSFCLCLCVAVCPYRSLLVVCELSVCAASTSLGARMPCLQACQHPRRPRAMDNRESGCGHRLDAAR